MEDKFEKGELPLNLYCNMSIRLIDGQGGVQTNVERGIEVLKLGAEKGDPNCQYSMGREYSEGVYGLPKYLSVITNTFFCQNQHSFDSKPKHFSVNTKTFVRVWTSKQNPTAEAKSDRPSQREPAWPARS